MARLVALAVTPPEVPRSESPWDPQELVDEAHVFSALSPAARALIASCLEPMTIGGGEVLMREGDEPDAMYLIAVGRLRVTMNRDDGTQSTLAELGRGEVVGEMALIANDSRSATVTAVRDSQLLRLPTAAYLRLVSEHPEALRELTTRIVRRLVRSVRQGSPTSPVITIAVVPLDLDPLIMGFDERLHEAFERLTGRSSHVTSTATSEALGNLDLVSADRLASWFAAHEAGFNVVVYEADPAPTRWTDACIRQADLILFVASAAASPEMRPLEREVSARRHHTPCRTELVLVHPLGTRDPRGTRRWLISRTVGRHHHVMAERDADIDRVARLLVGRGIGAVFSGGGARGIANIGVLRALNEHGVPIDAVGGTSLGAVVAGCAARGQSTHEIATLLRRAVVESSPFDITFPAVSLAAGRRVTAHLRSGTEGLDLEDYWRSVFHVSTNLTSGEIEVHRRGPSWRAARASFSIPGVYPPVRNENGELLVDGGLLDNLPVGVMRAEHHGITVIAADVGRTRDLNAERMPGDGVVSGWEMLLRRLDPLAAKSETVGLARILMRLTELGSERSDDRGDVYIRPAVEAFGIADFKAFDRLVELGYAATNRAVGEWITRDSIPLGSAEPFTRHQPAGRTP